MMDQRTGTIRVKLFGQTGRASARCYEGCRRDYDDLAALGIRAVINLASDDADPHEQDKVAASA